MRGKFTSWKIQSEGNVRDTSIMISSTVWALLTTGWSLAGSSATVWVWFFFLFSLVVNSFSYAWDWKMSNNSATGEVKTWISGQKSQFTSLQELKKLQHLRLQYIHVQYTTITFRVHCRKLYIIKELML